jgi:hypothetical protein
MLEGKTIKRAEYLTKKRFLFCFTLQESEEEVKKELGNIKDISYTTEKIMKLMDITEFTEKVFQAVKDNVNRPNVTLKFFNNFLLG